MTENKMSRDLRVAEDPTKSKTARQYAMSASRFRAELKQLHPSWFPIFCEIGETSFRGLNSNSDVIRVAEIIGHSTPSRNAASAALQQIRSENAENAVAEKVGIHSLDDVKRALAPMSQGRSPFVEGTLDAIELLRMNLLILNVDTSPESIAANFEALVAARHAIDGLIGSYYLHREELVGLVEARLAGSTETFKADFPEGVAAAGALFDNSEEILRGDFSLEYQ